MPAKTATPAPVQKKSVVASTPAPTPVVEASTAPKKSPAPKKESAPKKEAEPTPVATTTTTEVSAPAEGGASEETTLSGSELIIKKMQTQIDELTAQHSALSVALKSLNTAMKSLVKEHAKERKDLLKKAEKNTRRSRTTRNPSGFAKSAPISDELATFLGVEKGSQLARTDATRRINAYIKSNKLQDEKAKKNILCDEKLKALLKPSEGEVVHFFNLQRFLKKHFLPSPPASTSANTSA